VELKQGSLEALPLDAGACDGALLLLALTYVEDPAAVLAEARARSFGREGASSVTDLLRHDREEFRREMGQLRLGFDTQEMEALLGTAGLDDVRVRALAPDPRAKGPALLLAKRATPGARPRKVR
jgi:ArsR family transcriptional regulator